VIRVTPYTSDRAADFLQIYRACLEHYGFAPPSPDTESHIIGLLNAERHMACHLAYDADTCVGFTTWGLSFPAGITTSLVMKELFVSPDAQGQGVGRAILAELTRVAEAEGCTRLDWATDGSNKSAQAFYTKIGAPVKDKVSYRVNATDFDSFRKGLTHNG
jgi:GNAT superfamily N-acetyltransferase